jgi:hypothetical protein
MAMSRLLGLTGRRQLEEEALRSPWIERNEVPGIATSVNSELRKDFCIPYCEWIRAVELFKRAREPSQHSYWSMTSHGQDDETGKRGIN